MTTPFTTVPPCVDHAGHRFRIDLVSKHAACCERCGLIRRTTPKGGVR